MATPTKLAAVNGAYGHSGNGSYTNPAGNHLYAGKSAGTSNYRSRIVFPPLSSKADVANSRIVITKMVLYLRRNDGGPTTVTAGASPSGKWGASRAGTGSARIPASTAWHAIDVTACADAVAGYASNWYMHLTGSSDNRIRFDGIDKTYKPYLMVTWEYVAATISGDSENVTLGSPVTFTIRPEVEGETHALEYSIGEASGVIAVNAGDSVTWTPPVSLASEITGDDTGMVEIRMTAYDASGNVQRTERYYQTVTVPESVAPALGDAGAVLVGGLSGYGLTGRSYASIAPVIDMNGAMGAAISSVTAQATNGSASQTIRWTDLTESDAGVFTGAAADTGVFAAEGAAEIVLTVADSRGRTVTAKQTFTVCAYAPPVISEFSVERYESVYDENEEVSGDQASDLGGHVWVNLEAKAADVNPAGTQLNALQWRIEAVNAETGEVKSVSGEGTQPVEAAFRQNKTLFPEAVAESETWNYTLTVTDSVGGSAVQYDSVLPGRANFALAHSKYGAAFGGVPKGTKENPMLESWYPGYFYGGIHGVNLYSADEADTGGRWIDGKRIYMRVFTRTIESSEAGRDTAIAESVDGSFAPETIVRMEGMFVRSSGVVNPLSYYYSDSVMFLAAYSPDPNYGVFIRAAQAGTAFVIVYYTKKT